MAKGKKKDPQKGRNNALKLEESAEEGQAYVPDAPNLSATLGASLLCTGLIFVLASGQSFLTKFTLSLCITGLFLLRYVMGEYCSDPYAPLSEREISRAREKALSSQQ